jgi:hypothetical protein
MAHIFVGAFTTAVFLLVIISAQKRNIHVKWWQWILTFFEYIYFIFVLEVIYSFLQEGAAKRSPCYRHNPWIYRCCLGFLVIPFYFFPQSR